MTEGPGSRPEEAEGNPRLALLLAMAMFVPVVDTSLMNVSISSVVHNLDSSRSRWVGFAFLTTGMVVLIPIVPRADSGWDLVVPMLIAGSGLGLLVSQLNNYTLSPISEERVSEAAGCRSGWRSLRRWRCSSHPRRPPRAIQLVPHDAPTGSCAISCGRRDRPGLGRLPSVRAHLMVREKSIREGVAGWMRGRAQRRGLRPRDAAILITLVWLVAVVLFGILERIVEPETFPTIWLGMWWALETVTTVGYGDVVPSSGTGRLIGAIVMISGIAFLTVITAAVTATLIEAARRRLPAPPERELPAEFMREVTSRLSAIEARLDELGPRARE
jgi:voltage-gated potassium channel